MNYLNRAEVESMGAAGVRTYEITEGETHMQVCRQLSSYWLATKFTDNGIAEHFKNDGFWEAWITLWISKNVPPASVCIDAGANYGYYTFMLAQHGCKVIAVEANPELIPYLVKSIELNGCKDRVSVLNRAIADQSNKDIVLSVLESSLNTTIQDEEGFFQNKTGEITIESLALDDLLPTIGQPIDFVKMDIEGSEEIAFKGMQKLWKVNPNFVLLMEFVPRHYEQRGKLFFEKVTGQYSISYVDYDGNEQPLDDYSFFETDTEELRMLVIRIK